MYARARTFAVNVLNIHSGIPAACGVYEVPECMRGERASAFATLGVTNFGGIFTPDRRETRNGASQKCIDVFRLRDWML